MKKIDKLLDKIKRIKNEEAERCNGVAIISRKRSGYWKAKMSVWDRKKDKCIKEVSNTFYTRKEAEENIRDMASDVPYGTTIIINDCPGYSDD